jgi:hypothetical protein
MCGVGHADTAENKRQRSKTPTITRIKALDLILTILNNFFKLTVYNIMLIILVFRICQYIILCNASMQCSIASQKMHWQIGDS